MLPSEADHAGSRSNFSLALQSLSLRPRLWECGSIGCCHSTIALADSGLLPQQSAGSAPRHRRTGTPSVRNETPILSPMRASPNQDSNPPGRPQSPRKSNRLARKTDRSHAAWLPGEVKIVKAATTPGRAPNPVPPSQELPLRSGGGLCRLSRPRPGNVSPTAMHREPCECPGLVSAPALSRVLPLPTIHWIFPKITAVFRGIITILANEWTDFSSLIPSLVRRLPHSQWPPAHRQPLHFTRVGHSQVDAPLSGTGFDRP